MPGPEARGLHRVATSADSLVLSALAARGGRLPEVEIAMATKPKSQDRTFPTHIDIPAEKRTALIEMLNQSLADTSDLYSQVKQAHWNVKGKDFYQLHILFDEIAEEIEPFQDLLAERLTLMGGYAKGTVRMAAGSSTLPEYPTEITGGMEHVEALVERFGHFVGKIRTNAEDADEIGDPGTADLYTDLVRIADKRLWFLEAHIQG